MGGNYMTKEQVLNSDALKRRFIKDCNLPISLTDNPYFMERLELQNLFTDAIDKFDRFCKTLEPFNNEQEYFEYYRNLKESIIEDIKTSAGFERFNKYNFDHTSIFTKRDLYKEFNDDCLFISIDMVQANFNVLNFFDTSIFAYEDGSPCECWEDFIGQYTKDKHFAESKYIRQVILGNCNPKKQIQYQDYLMNILAEHIHNELPTVDIYSVHNDEIILKADKVDGTCKFDIALFELEEIIEYAPYYIGELVRTDTFELHKIPNSNGWMKISYDEEEPQFKCLEVETYNQYIKHYYDIPITENDLVFRHNGRLARFLEGVDNPWET